MLLLQLASDDLICGFHLLGAIPSADVFLFEDANVFLQAHKLPLICLLQLVDFEVRSGECVVQHKAQLNGNGVSPLGRIET